jgi:hypothetical protein
LPRGWPGSLPHPSSGDIAEALGRSFERLEQRIDAAESRIHSRISELEVRIEVTAVGSAD